MTAAPRSDDRTSFFNPYNFVRPLPAPDTTAAPLLGRRPPPPRDRASGYSGTITLELEALTPLLVPDAERVSRDAAGHPSYPFLTLDGQRVIPGSSVRGAVRAVFEAATNSCFSVFDPRAVSRRPTSEETQEYMPGRIEQDDDGSWWVRLLPGDCVENPRTARREPLQPAAWIALPELWQPRPYSKEPYLMRPPTRFIGAIAHEDACWAVIGRQPITHRVAFFHVTALLPATDAADAAAAEERFKAEGVDTQGRRVVFGWANLTGRTNERKKHDRFFYDANAAQGIDEWRLPLPEQVRDAFTDLVESARALHAHELLPAGLQWSPLVTSRDAPMRHGRLVYLKLGSAGRDNVVEYLAPVSLPRLLTRRRRGDLLPAHLLPCGAQRSVAPLTQPAIPAEPANSSADTTPATAIEGDGGMAPPAARELKHDAEAERVTPLDLVAGLLRAKPAPAQPAPTDATARHGDTTILLCPACRVFGWVGRVATGATAPAVRGRVQVGHAEEVPSAASDDHSWARVVLAPLAEPKPSAAYFYIRPVTGRPENGHVPESYSYDNPAYTLRGRKFYRRPSLAGFERWGEFQSPRDGAERVRTVHNRTGRDLAAPGSRFRCTVRFEDLQPVELGALLWALAPFTGGGALRLGAGRPLGLGVVRPRITRFRAEHALAAYTALDPAIELAPGLRAVITGMGEHVVEAITPFVAAFESAMARAYGAPFAELASTRDLAALLAVENPHRITYPRLTRERFADTSGLDWWEANRASHRDTPARNGRKVALDLAAPDDGSPERPLPFRPFGVPAEEQPPLPRRRDAVPWRRPPRPRPVEAEAEVAHAARAERALQRELSAPPPPVTIGDLLAREPDAAPPAPASARSAGPAPGTRMACRLVRRLPAMGGRPARWEVETMNRRLKGFVYDERVPGSWRPGLQNVELVLEGADEETGRWRFTRAT